jgi:hypothetical protein
MSTLEQLTDRVDTLLHGYSLNTEAATWLTAAVTNATTTTFSVDSASVVSRGFAQINDEMVYVHSTNNIDNEITLAPWGRGQRGTVAATSHANLSKITVAPIFPRFEIKKAINDTLNAMYPQIFAVRQTQFNYIAARTTYDIPDAAQNILSVTHSVIGPSKEWMPVRAWQFDRTANPTAFGDGTNFGHSLSVYSPIVPGRTVNVAYSTRPTLFNLATTDAQEYGTTTGMPDYSEDVVIYGAAWRMISFLDPSRLGPLSAEADVLDNQRGARSGENAARFLFNVYNTRLNEVAENQRRQFPIRSHYQR